MTLAVLGFLGSVLPGFLGSTFQYLHDRLALSNTASMQAAALAAKQAGRDKQIGTDIAKADADQTQNDLQP